MGMVVVVQVVVVVLGERVRVRVLAVWAADVPVPVVRMHGERLAVLVVVVQDGREMGDWRRVGDRVR